MPKMLDVLFIEGNKDYRTEQEHQDLMNKVLSLSPDASVGVINSEDPNQEIPKAKVYIGFSRGTRYFKKLKDRQGIKISIGGKSGKYAELVKNNQDRTSKGDHSKESMDAHFTITPRMEQRLNKILNVTKV